MSCQLRNAEPCSPSRPPKISRQRLGSLQGAPAITKRADAQRPGDIVVNELEEQLRALKFKVTACKKRGLRLDGTIRHLLSGDEVWFEVTATHSELLKELRLTRLRKAAGKIGNRMKSAPVLDAQYFKKLDKLLSLRPLLNGS
jgi:hypothetical protein